MDQLLVRRLRAAFEAEGVDFAATVCLIPYLDRPQFFGLMSHATLLLDTIEFSGFNNTLQAIEAGLPVLAYEGRFLRGRLASGILRRMELPGLIANGEEEYIQAAVRLACDPSACLAWRHGIARRRGKLFNDIGSVRALENSLIAAVNQRRG